MKKVLVGVSVVLVALVIFGAGFIFAQSNVANAAGLPAVAGLSYMMGGHGGGRGGDGAMMGGNGMMGGGQQVHEYVEQALADKLGMTLADVDAAFASGKSISQIATDKGTKAADLTALLTDVHKTAFAKAVTDGILTQAQADTMLQAMTANGFNDANGMTLAPARSAGVGGRGGRGQGGNGQNGRGQGGMTHAPAGSAGVGGRNWQPQVTPTVAP